MGDLLDLNKPERPRLVYRLYREKCVCFVGRLRASFVSIDFDAPQISLFAWERSWQFGKAPLLRVLDTIPVKTGIS